MTKPIETLGTWSRGRPAAVLSPPADGLAWPRAAVARRDGGRGARKVSHAAIQPSHHPRSTESAHRPTRVGDASWLARRARGERRERQFRPERIALALCAAARPPASSRDPATHDGVPVPCRSSEHRPVANLHDNHGGVSMAHQRSRGHRRGRAQPRSGEHEDLERYRRPL